jgi:HK97 gp10 family phage protein
MKLSGFDDVEAALKELPKATSKNVVKRAMLDAAEPMVQDAKGKAPRREGDLAEGISATAQIVSSQAPFSRKPGKGEVRVFVGPNYKPGTPGYAPHAHLVEFGTGPRFTESGASRGQMPAEPYIRPAYDGGKHGFIDRLSQSILAEIEKAKARLARKNARKAR